MTLEFEAPLGTRLHRYYWGVTTFESLWWCYEKRAWVPSDRVGNQGSSTHAPCRTIRAFKRMLRKNPNIVGKAILVNRYQDHAVYSRSSDSAPQKLETTL